MTQNIYRDAPIFVTDCTFCNEPISGEAQIWESPTLGCEYPIHAACIDHPAKREMVMAESAYFYGGN